jgi:hypothetical protein
VIWSRIHRLSVADGIRPLGPMPMTVGCLSWNKDRASISLADALQAEKAHANGLMTDSEWGCVRDWFAPWADMTGEVTTAMRWWPKAVQAIRVNPLMKKVMPRGKLNRLWGVWSTDRRDWKPLVKCFQHYNAQDASHSMLDLGSALALLVVQCGSKGRKDPRAQCVYRAFADASCEVTRSLMTSWVVWCTTVPAATLVAPSILDYHVFAMSRVGFRDSLKAVTAAMQRTLYFRTSDAVYNRIGLDELAACAYLHEFTGRAGWTYPWEKDYELRINPANKPVLMAPDAKNGMAWSNDAWIEMYRDVLDEVQREATPRAPLDETSEEHFARRQDWVAGGSGGGEKVIVGLPDLQPFPPDPDDRPDGWDVGRMGDIAAKPRKPPTARAARVTLSRGLRAIVTGGDFEIPTGPSYSLRIGTADEAAHYVWADSSTPPSAEHVAELMKWWKKRVHELRTWHARPRERVHRLKKRAVVESLDYEGLMKATEVPECKATFSDKFDRAAARSIYGTTVPHYVRSAYVFSAMEGGQSKVPELCGKLTSDEQGTMDNDLMNEEGYTLCADHSGFDEIHTLEFQRDCVLSTRRAAECKTRAEVRRSWEREVDWLAASLMNQKVVVPQHGEFTVSQGMFTGMRGTACLNDRGHVVYWRSALRVARLAGDTGLTVRACKIRGDDVMAKMGTWVSCATVLGSLTAIGFRLNPLKQLISKQYGVFLRVIYSKGAMRGYSPRAISSLVSQPLQAQEWYDPKARAEAFDAHIHMMVRRGCRMSACSRLWWNLMRFWARQKKGKDGYVRIPSHILTASKAVGGWGLCPPGHVGAVVKGQIPPYPAVVPRTSEVGMLVGSKMSSDAATRLAANYVGFEADAAAMLASQYRRSNLEPEATPKEVGKARANHAEELGEWLNKARASCSVAEPCIRVCRPRYVIAPPGSGKSYEVALSGAELKMKDGDDIVHATCGWDQWNSEDFDTRHRARNLYCTEVARLVRAGHIVVAAHSDGVVLSRLEQLGTPIVWVDIEASSRQWRLRMRGQNLSVWAGRTGGQDWASNRARSGLCSVAPNLTAAIEWPVLQPRLTSEEPLVANTAEAVYLLGRRGPADRRKGRRHMVGQMGFAEILECVDKTALRSMANLTAMSKLIGMDPMNLLAREVDITGRTVIAEHIRARKDRLREVFNETPIIDRGLTAMLSPHINRVLLAAYNDVLLYKVSTERYNLPTARLAAQKRCESMVREAFVMEGAGKIIMV